MAGNILLIGFMGVGKGRVARALVEKTGMFGVDTDDLIESLENMKIRKIFALRGEPCFRELEQRTADWLRRNVSNTIVSTGGGFFKVRKLGRKDTVVYLHSSLENIIAAMNAHPKAKKKIRKRPLLQDLESVTSLYEERLPLYRKAADLEVNVEQREAEDIAAEIMKKLNPG
ncbi:MAG: AAA family ATPase [Desulfobulbaceae bacterium]|nr:AAA family ATPase [Desulfobulbaceae bacterium]